MPVLVENPCGGRGGGNPKRFASLRQTLATNISGRRSGVCGRGGGGDGDAETPLQETLCKRIHFWVTGGERERGRENRTSPGRHDCGMFRLFNAICIYSGGRDRNEINRCLRGDGREREGGRE